MQNKKEHIISLLQKAQSRQASEAEYAELIALIEKDASYELSAYIQEYLAAQKTAATAKEYDYESWNNRALDILLADRVKEPNANRITHRVHFLRTAWFRYAAAVILLIGVGGYLLWRESGEIPASGENEKGSVVRTQPANTNKAILTLASGKKIELDNNTKTPLLVKEGPVFDPREAVQKPGVASYNTITTPKGSQYQLILPDGTKAWLNAASSIKFPTTFTGATRRIIITGEVFFEVSMNKTAPFFVSSKGIEVQVLGTSFNIKAYEGEEATKTSLLQGSIKVNEKILQPGQAYKNGQVITTDLDQDIAWKNGLFNFEGLNVKEVMNQLERWYDIEVVYEGPMPDVKFLGELHNTTKLPVVLKALQGAGLSFRMEGRKLIVSQ